MTDVVPASDVKRAARLLGDGLVIAVPTDTVYGLAARFDRDDAVARLFALTGRPAALALPVMVADLPQLESLELEWNDRARRLADELWPGPLTIVVAASETVSRRAG